MSDRAQILNDPEEAIRLALDGRLSSVWTTLPGIVTAVNFIKMTVEVQPTIQGVILNENGVRTYVNLPLLLDVPMVFQSSGGFTITLPVSVDDECLVSFSSRCIDAWFQSGGVQKPMELRMHDLSDGFAFFGPKSLPNVISSISSTDLQIRNDEGTTYIGLKPNGDIDLVAPNINVTGSINVTGEVTANGIALSTHTHSGVTAGTDPSGPPI